MTQPLPAEPDRDATPRGVVPRPHQPGKQLAGWYPAFDNPTLERYWDGGRWAGDPRARLVQPQYAMPPAQPGAQPVYYAQPAFVPQQRTQHVSGLTTGGHLIHGILTVCPLGLWAPIWILVWFLGRRRIR